MFNASFTPECCQCCRSSPDKGGACPQEIFKRPQQCLQTVREDPFSGSNLELGDRQGLHVTAQPPSPSSILFLLPPLLLLFFCSSLRFSCSAVLLSLPCYGSSPLSLGCLSQDAWFCNLLHQQGRNSQPRRGDNYH